MAFCWFLVFLLSRSADMQSSAFTSQLQGSQAPWPVITLDEDANQRLPVNPRVGCCATTAPETPLRGVKLTGQGHSIETSWNASRKRSYRRAKRRAERQGGTWYRGKWLSAAALGVPTHACVSNSETPTVRRPPATRTRPRFQAISYNIGGITPEGYDTLKEWLDNACTADLVLLQETHWGFGREDQEWTLTHWSVITSADPRNRFAGVAILLRKSRFPAQGLSHCTWIPGRLLQVRYRDDYITVDAVVGYQWVWQERDKDKIAKQREHFWTQLSKLCQGIPARHLLFLGADFNSVCRPISGLVGRGVLKTTRPAEPALDTLLDEQKLVLLNTLSSSQPKWCFTFKHGSVETQIDFLAVRRRHADRIARSAKPRNLDLAPWRQGPKHRPLEASLPWVSGWVVAPRTHKPIRFSLQSMRKSLQTQDDKAQLLRQKVQQVVSSLPEAATILDLNKQLLPVCRSIFPPTNKPQPADHGQALVVASVRNMWTAHRAMSMRGRAVSVRNVVAAWKQYVLFRRAYQALRQASRNRRASWLEAQVISAEEAAQRNDIATVYRIVNQIAPKKRRDRVRIRSAAGHILSAEQEYEEIFRYFSRAFQRDADFEYSTEGLQIVFTAEELGEAISKLKSGKAVPTGSVPADVWGVCPQLFAERYCRILNQGCSQGFRLPSEATDCALSLLPKPGRSSRRPGDLRPLGLQDPSSKVLALALKDRLMPYVADFISSRPQFAYCPHKAIDDAICRVAGHCSRVRERIRKGVLSVHDKRAGKVESRCYGGIMLSLDLSRAFDELPRAVLLRTLEYAGTPPELCAIIISVHEACKYTVHHGGQVGSFHMAKGVRQGCTLAPLLYSLYTCWLYDELSRRTDEVWAARLLTLFADDTHVPFEIECAADLGFAVRAIRCVFSLFKETGMVVNAGKSKVVVGLRGSAARRWLRRRCCVTDGSTALNFGTPHDPLVIPRVASFVHLGVVASYGSFEALTLSHRLKAASSNRQRLMSVLHCGRFALRHRVRLYVACIRSTLHFGLHAVGVTPATLRRLEAYDARALRAIARSPVHLTRESNDSLRRRLGVASPLAALQKMLGRRQVHSSDEHSRYVYGERLLQLQQVTTAVAAEDAFFQGIPCPECGQYFLNHRHMRSHRACKHAPLKRQSTKAPRAQSQGTGAVSADTYASFALDGMPNCRFCKQSFTRVEGLKKHILQGCQCFTQPERSPPEVTSASGVQVAPERGESTRPATPLVASAQSSTALYADADFIRDLRADWRAVVAKDNIKTSLSTYCVFCHQWISLEGPGFKQHARVMHPNHWQCSDAALARTRSLGFKVTSPCYYCGKSCQDPRRHIRSCTPVFQAALAYECLQVEDGRPNGGGDEGHGGSGGAGPCFRVPGVQGGSPGGSTTQVDEAGRRQGSSASLGRLGEPVQAPMGADHTVERRSARQADTSPSASGHSPHPQARKRACTTSSRHQLCSLHRYWKPLVPADASGCGQPLVGPLRQGPGHDAVAHYAHDGLGPEPEADHRRGATERGAACSLQGRRLDPGRISAHQPQLGLFWLGSQTEAAGRARDGCGLHLRHPDDAGLHGIPSEEGWCSSELQERQAAGGAGECGSGAVCSDNQPPNSSSGRDAPHFLPPIWQCLLQTARLPSAPGKDRQAASGKTARDEVPGDGVLRLEVERQLAGPGGDLGRSSAPAVPRAAQQWACRSLSIPMAKLLNPRGQNLCYANSCLQAWYWLSQMVDSSEHIGGRIQAGLRTIGRSGSRHLPSCMVFQPLFSCWQHVHQQHDAGEFWLHLVNVARSPAFDGFWEARLTNPPSLVDSGTLFHPLILQPGSSLQSMIDDWHQQFAVHGLKESVSALCVQLARYSRDGQKNQCCIDIQPGASVGMPVFCASGDVGVDTRRIAYRVVFIVFHLGLTVHSGHYQTALCVPTAGDSGESAWGFKICNDNRQPRAASPRDLRTLAANSYLIGLLRE